MKQSLLKGEDIYNGITSSLKEAKTTIFVVSAWFTDQSLLDLLVFKIRENVEVSVVIGDNKDNLRLDFSEFESLGGALRRIKGNGYGMMHQKYCVIDEKTAFHGSYNWTINARRNNEESVIKTNHKTIIEELVNDFKKLTMEKETLELKEANTSKGWFSRFKRKPKIELKENNDSETNIEKEKIVLSLDDVFKSIISAEIKKTNREEVKGMAYSQAKEVSGDAQVITKSMDSLYHLFISDKKENDKNKEKLFNKIEDKVSEFTQNINTEKDEKLNSVKIEIISEQKKIEFQKTETTRKKSNKEVEKKNIRETTIVNIKNQISNLKDKISALDIEFVKPMFKYHEFIPKLLFFIGLSIAMILFYSSSAYIMLYSYEDALLAAEAGINVNPQVYDARAFSKSISKGGSATFYILFFVFIPFAIAYVAHDVEKENKKQISNVLKKCGSYFVVILIDTFIAFKVSATIGEINYLSKGIEFERSFWDVNFWLVFFLGAIPFFFLAELMNKLINFFAERSAQSGRERMLVEKKVAKTKMDVLEEEITTHVENTNDMELEINNLESVVYQLEQALIFLPKELDSKTSQINQEGNNSIANVRKKADVYRNDIENDNIQISLSSLKDRVSAFIEGWNEWLHDEYATEKAMSKSQEAIQESDLWLVDNMKKIEA
jgi:hypothetical protein